MLAFHFYVEVRHSENAAFQKRWCHNNNLLCDFPDQVFLKHKSKMTGDCCIFKCLWHSANGKTSAFKFLWHSVDGT